MFRRKSKRNLVDEFEVPLEKAQGESRLFELFKNHKGRLLWKWDHYLNLYDRHFGKFEAPRLLEIGVWQGGSLELWRKYFGPGATICGIDIDPGCRVAVDAPNLVRIGTQDDPVFLRSVVEEMGGLDIVLDDGSHFGKHQIASFETLFPLLSYGGVYAIEDLHTSYWSDFDGSYRKHRTGVGLIKQLIDDLHQWWHERGGQSEIGAIHVYDSIAFIEKARARPPQGVKVS